MAHKGNPVGADNGRPKPVARRCLRTYTFTNEDSKLIVRGSALDTGLLGIREFLYEAISWIDSARD